MMTPGRDARCGPMPGTSRTSAWTRSYRDLRAAPGSTRSAWRPPTMPGVSCSRAARAERPIFPRTARSISSRPRHGGTSRDPPARSPIVDRRGRRRAARAWSAGATPAGWASRAGRCACTTPASACSIRSAVTRNAFGDPNYYTLCPSQPGRASLCPRRWWPTSPTATGPTGSSSRAHPSWVSPMATITRRTASA